MTFATVDLFISIYYNITNKRATSDQIAVSFPFEGSYFTILGFRGAVYTDDGRL